MYSPKTLEALNAMFLAQHGTAVVIGNLPYAFDLPAVEENQLANRKKFGITWAKELWESVVLALSITTKIPPLTGGAYPPVINGYDVVTQPVKAACWVLLNDAEKWEDLTQTIEKLMTENYVGNTTALVSLAYASKYADYAWKWSNIGARALFDSMDEV